MPRATSPAGLRRRERAAALGITVNALRHRELSKKSRLPARLAPVWIGARIWPPIEDDHPALSQEDSA